MPRREELIQILDTAFGPLSESDPERWDERAYLMLVGLLYLYLATTEGEISIAELSTLAKALADARRARFGDSTPRGRRRAARTGAASEAAATVTLGDIVRQVYGVEPPTLG
ncbi:MAG: hypothetical protein HY763_03735 [Planctomycetes bacterium]|nr:hypothetical protein [Planctomycetota bacterium]